MNEWAFGIFLSLEKIHKYKKKRLSFWVFIKKVK